MQRLRHADQFAQRCRGRCRSRPPERGALAAALAAASHENDSIAHAKGHWVRAGGGTPEEDAWPSLRALEEDVSDRREMVAAINAAAAAAALKASNDVPVE